MIPTLIIAFLSLIVLMVIHEFGHFIIAKKFKVRVDEFGVGYPPRLFGKKIGETIYSVNLIPLGAFVRIHGEEGGVDDYRSFMGLKIWKRVLIVIGGVAAFWLASIILFSVVFSIGVAIPVGDQDVQGVSDAQVKIIFTTETSPARAAGLAAGDAIINIKGEDLDVKVNKISDFQKAIDENKGKEIVLTIERKGKTFDASLAPRISYPSTEGPLGVGLERMATIVQKYPWYLAPIKGTVYCADITAKSVIGLAEVFKNLVLGKGLPQGAEMAGPLGITVFLARAADYGIGFFLYFIATISVFIAIFNLFPIPALDGGKLIFLAIEKIRKKAVPVKVEQSVTVVFFLLLITLSIFVTVKFDIPRFSDFLKSSLQK